ncbi:MAG: hypothetical protein OXC91_01150 [Rhodobacteraceae bacterium]|nr:hypothetical protein [Paracoccaceae bacterium]
MANVLTMDQIAELGEEIYEACLRKKHEGRHNDMFLAIDVTTKRGHLGQYPEDALKAGEEDNPEGQFYLKRIGSPATFHVSYIGEMDVDGILQPA